MKLLQVQEPGSLQPPPPTHRNAQGVVACVCKPTMDTSEKDFYHYSFLKHLLIAAAVAEQHQQTTTTNNNNSKLTIV